MEKFILKKTPWQMYLDDTRSIALELQLNSVTKTGGAQMRGFYRMEQSYEKLKELLQEYKTLLEQDLTDAQNAAAQMEAVDANLANTM